MDYVLSVRPGASVYAALAGLVVGLAALGGCGGQVESSGKRPTAAGGDTAAGGGVSLGGGASPGGGPSTGGATSSGGGTFTSIRACSIDSDCTLCIYISAPSNPEQCDGALGCCGGTVTNQATCAINEAAWEANCAGRGYERPVCPCLACVDFFLTCAGG